MLKYKYCLCRRDGIGRRAGLKIQWWRHRAGSTPAAGTKKSPRYQLDIWGFSASKADFLFSGAESNLWVEKHIYKQKC